MKNINVIKYIIFIVIIYVMWNIPALHGMQPEANYLYKQEHYDIGYSYWHRKFVPISSKFICNSTDIERMRFSCIRNVVLRENMQQLISEYAKMSGPTHIIFTKDVISKISGA